MKALQLLCYLEKAIAGAFEKKKHATLTQITEGMGSHEVTCPNIGFDSVSCAQGKPKSSNMLQVNLLMAMEKLVPDFCTLRGLASQALASYHRQELH